MSSGGDGSCSATALVKMGVFDSVPDAKRALDDMIPAFHEELQRLRGPCDQKEAGIPGEQWHVSIINKVAIAQGFHVKKVMIETTNHNAVKLKDVLKVGNYLVIGTTNNLWYNGSKRQPLKYPDEPVNGPVVDRVAWNHSIAVVNGLIRDSDLETPISSLWLKDNNKVNPDKGYMREIRAVFRVFKCRNPGKGCRGECIHH
jgi:hypothetical protein